MVYTTFMKNTHKELTQLQDLVLSILNVKRNHRIPETDRRENVVEHSFSVAMFCWRLYSILKPDLDLGKILKYAFVHDFSERGQYYDTNTYADKSERSAKEEREAKEIEKISNEFSNFIEMVTMLNSYETFVDEEARFVWAVDKMQGMILGGLDGWRPYKLYGVKYATFLEKGNEFISKCPPCLKEVMQEVVAESCKTYYDQPV